MGDDPGARFIGSALGSVVAETLTLPADVAKVRLQVQKTAEGGIPKYTGLVDCLRKTAKEEGPKAMWKGLAPALVRQVSYTSMSMVIYEPVRDFYKGILPGKADGQPTFVQRLAAGGTAGAISISIFNPAEVIKTKIQTNATTEILTMRGVANTVFKNDGILGFWAGVKPNVARTFIVNAAELGTYDEAKTRIRPYLGDGFATHVSASGIAGFSSACVSTPADVVKTRLMNAAGGKQQYNGMLHAGYRIFMDEGPLALYKGFLPICVRKLIWVSAFFVSYENIRATVNNMA